MLFSTIVLPCHYTTHSTQIPVVQWWYKSYCTDRARDSFTFPESLGVSGSDLGATSHLNCPDKSRTVRIVASGRGSSMTLAEHYKGRDISIINKADLHIGRLQRGDSGVYFCKVVIADDLEGKNEGQVELLVQDPGLSPGAVAGIVVVLLLVFSAVAAAGVFYYHRKVSELQKETKKISKQLEQLPKISKQLEQLKKTYEKELPKISEKEMLKISDKLKRMSEISEQEMPKISEHLKQLRTKVTKQQTTRSDLERGGEERRITVQDTAISQATGDVKTSIEEQSKKISIRKNSSEDAGVHTPDPTESQGNESVTVETPLLKKEHDGENKPEDTTPG
ncbi:uncharacterized protein [Chanodichthys erythropterus]